MLMEFLLTAGCILLFWTRLLCFTFHPGIFVWTCVIHTDFVNVLFSGTTYPISILRKLTLSNIWEGYKLLQFLVFCALEARFRAIELDNLMPILAGFASASQLSWFLFVKHTWVSYLSTTSTSTQLDPPSTMFSP